MKILKRIAHFMKVTKNIHKCYLVEVDYLKIVYTAPKYNTHLGQRLQTAELEFYLTQDMLC